MKAAAISYALLGWPVVPIHSVSEYSGGCTCLAPGCREVAKHPILSKSRYREGSKDLHQIEKWWTDYPMANVSIVTGFPSRIIVLDIDLGKGGEVSLSRLIEGRFGPLPKTMKSRTGGGGWHFFFRHPGNELRGRIGMRPGVDVRAEEMNCIMPPSRHKSGGVYSWVEGHAPGEIEIAHPPDWLIRMIQTKNPPVPRKLKLAGWF